VERLEQSETDDETDDEEEFRELEGDELLQSLQQQGEGEHAAIEASNRFRELQRTITKKEWKKAESSKQGVYKGGASSTQRREAKNARDAEEKIRKPMRNS
jgi:hypothetical protein